jgi:hypothetical protein
MREIFKNLDSHHSGGFRFRGVESGRIENFSDAVFALAITLLLISTSPPTNFEQIKRFVWELIPFGICIAIIMLIWYQHFIFFYRYGIRNSTVLVLNTIFLVIVLFYVYPLKYLARGILIPVAYLLDQSALLKQMLDLYRGGSVADLMIIYGLGASAVFIILSIMYRYAWKRSDDLELNAIERFDTRTSMITNLLLASVPLTSVMFAVVLHNNRWVGMWSGFSYFLYPVVMTIYGTYIDRKRRSLLESLI